MSCGVRTATLNDLPEILTELKSFASFFGSKTSLYGDDDYPEKFISGLIQDHLFLVAVMENKIVGLIAGMRLPHVFNPKIMTLTEIFWWVNPEYRNTRAGALLLKEYVDFGKKNVDWIICTIEDGSPVNENTFYKRGFKLKEKSFLMEVN